MALEQHSENNIASSVATFLGQQLLTSGYLLYWYNSDAVQTPDGWYHRWSTDFATLKTDPTLAARLASAAGLFTLKGKATAKPVFPARHTVDGSVPSEVDVPIPYLAIEVDVERPGDFSGIGDRMRERFRTLIIYGYARDDREQSALRDSLVRWFDDTAFVPLYDYDAGTVTAFGDVECQMPMADSLTVGVEPEATRYEVILNVRLRYEA